MRARLPWKMDERRRVDVLVKRIGRLSLTATLGKNVLAVEKRSRKASFRVNPRQERDHTARRRRTGTSTQNGATMRFSAKRTFRAILPNFASRLFATRPNPRVFSRAAAKQRVIHHHPLAVKSIHFIQKPKPRARLSRRDAIPRWFDIAPRILFLRAKKEQTQKAARHAKTRCSYPSSSSSSFSSLWGTARVRSGEGISVFCSFRRELSTLPTRVSNCRLLVFPFFFVRCFFGLFFFFDLSFFIHHRVHPSIIPFFFFAFFCFFGCLTCFLFVCVFSFPEKTQKARLLPSVHKDTHTTQHAQKMAGRNVAKRAIDRAIASAAPYHVEISAFRGDDDADATTTTNAGLFTRCATSTATPSSLAAVV